MSNPLTPNFNPQSGGRLAADRYDFQGHIDGTEFQHTAGMILLSPNLVVASTTYTDVQDALAAIIANLSPPLPLATATTPGIVQLSAGGDVQGTYNVMKVTGFQGRPINTVPPVVGNLLMWNGSSWGPSSAGTFVAGGDLSGTYNNQVVIGLSGTGTIPSRIVATHTDIIQFATNSTPLISQAAIVSGNGSNMNIRAQNTASSGSGGNLILHGGSSISGLQGGIFLTLGNNYLFQVVEVISAPVQQVAAFFPSNSSSGLTSTDMPANTGSNVIYIGDTTNPPLTSSPTGSILWSQGGQLNVMQEDGTSFVIANPGQTANPISADANSAVLTAPTPNPATTFGGTVTYTSGAQTTNNGFVQTVFDLQVPPSTSVNIVATLVAKEQGTVGSAFYSMVAQYVRNGSGNATLVLSPFTYGSSNFPVGYGDAYPDGSPWTAQPGFNLTLPNFVTLNTGANGPGGPGGGSTISWSSFVQVTYATTSS